MSALVALVGRPNVGKSTLFNRLTGKRLAIVHDAPGVTRDRHYAPALVAGREITLVDTGGFDPQSDDPMRQGISRHVRAAIAEADVVICVLDGGAEPTSADREAVELLRRSERPTVFVANKADTQAIEHGAASLHELGVGELTYISALHGRHIAELEDRIAALLPEDAEPPPPTDETLTRVAFLGRPNAGKSSLFNRLLGDERSLVDDRPGTTRDPVDSVATLGDRQVVLVDTAGIRRKTRVERGIEAASVMRALRAIERAQIVVLMVDATEGLAEQDARLLGLCIDRGRGLVVGLNKTDVMDREARKRAREDAEHALRFAAFVPIVELSAKTGRGVGELAKAVHGVAAEYTRRVTTAELNRFFEEVLEHRTPPVRGGRAPRIYYVTQAEASPPTFVAMSNAPDRIDASYKRFVVNQIRKRFGFEGVPIFVRYRKRGG